MQRLHAALVSARVTHSHGMVVRRSRPRASDARAAAGVGDHVLQRALHPSSSAVCGASISDTLARCTHPVLDIVACYHTMNITS